MELCLMQVQALVGLEMRDLIVSALSGLNWARVYCQRRIFAQNDG